MAEEAHLNTRLVLEEKSGRQTYGGSPDILRADLGSEYGVGECRRRIVANRASGAQVTSCYTCQRPQSSVPAHYSTSIASCRSRLYAIEEASYAGLCHAVQTVVAKPVRHKRRISYNLDLPQSSGKRQNYLDVKALARHRPSPYPGPPQPPPPHIPSPPGLCRRHFALRPRR